MAGILPIGRKTQDNQSKLWSNFNQVWHKEFFGKGDSGLLKFFPSGDDSKNTLMTFESLLQNQWAISKHTLAKGNQVCSDVGPHLFPMVQTIEIA